MMRFFRKYTRECMAVLMVLLMIVFIGGSALEGLLMQDTGGTVAFNSRLGDITHADQQAAKSTTDLLSSLGVNWSQPLFGSGAEPLNVMDWILLQREAKRLGVEANLSSVQRMVQQQTGLQTRIPQIAWTHQIQERQIHEALRQFATIQEVAAAVAGAAMVSEAEVRQAAYDALDRVDINVVELPADVFLTTEGEGQEFTDEQIAAQFEQYKDDVPGGGVEFGYYIEPQIRIEYIRIDRDKIAEQLRVNPATLERDARKYYDERKNADPLFRAPEEEKTAEDSAESAEPESAEEPEKPKTPRILEWEEAKEKAIQRVREARAGEAAGRMANWLSTRLADAWYAMGMDEDGYRKRPSGVEAEGYLEQIIKEIPGTIAYPDAVTVHTTGYFQQSEAADVDGIGSAHVFGQAGSWHTLASLAFNVQGILEIDPTDRAAPVSRLALYETCPTALRDAEGDHYLFRVVETRGAHVAASVDEVRQRVAEDLKLKAAYDAALAAGQKLLASVGEQGLKAAFDADEALTSLPQTESGKSVRFFEPQPCPRLPEDMAASGRVGDTRLVQGWAYVPAWFVDRLFALAASGRKHELIEIPEHAKVVVVELVERLVPREDGFAAMRDRLTMRMTAMRYQTALTNWLDPTNIEARNSLKAPK